MSTARRTLENQCLAVYISTIGDLPHTFINLCDLWDAFRSSTSRQWMNTPKLGEKSWRSMGQSTCERRLGSRQEIKVVCSRYQWLPPGDQFDASQPFSTIRNGSAWHRICNFSLEICTWPDVKVEPTIFFGETLIITYMDRHRTDCSVDEVGECYKSLRTKSLKAFGCNYFCWHTVGLGQV